MNKIRIRIFEDNHYVLRRLYSKGINIYKIQSDDKGYIYTIDSDDLNKIPFDFNVVSFMGLKGILYYINLHRHFIISILLSVTLMIVFSNIVISVEVIHSDKRVREIITDELYDAGIHPFTFKKSYDYLQEVKEKIKEKYPKDIEWLEIIRDGMKYTVRVEERIITDKVELPPYCDVISTKDAIVLSSKITSGQAVTAYNDFVKKGSTLISGKITFNENTKSYVCADGVVYGNTWYTVSISVPYTYEIKNYTGKKSRNISFIYGSKRTPIFKVHFDKYDVEEKTLLKIGRLTITHDTNLEYHVSKKIYTYDEVKEEAKKLGLEKMKTNLPSDAIIMDEKVLQTSNYDSIIEMDIFYSVKEIISKQVEKDKSEEEGKTNEITR